MRIRLRKAIVSRARSLRERFRVRKPKIILPKDLPPVLVARLRKAEKYIFRRLGKMENIDHRALEIEDSPEITYLPGRRVRGMNVSRNFPETRVVIKRVHHATAKDLINVIKERVQDFNTRHSNLNIELLQPIAYALNSDLVAMPKMDFPSIPEIIGKGLSKTERGMTAVQKWGLAGKQREAFVLAAANLEMLSDFSRQNILFLGMRKGKFVFMPLLDLH